METFIAEILNIINNLLLGLGSITGDLDNLDLITLNGLRLEHNNDHSSVGSLEVVSSLNRLLREHKEIFNCWFENWLISHVPKLMHHSKWIDDERDVKIGDIKLIESDQYPKDEKIRKVNVK